MLSIFKKELRSYVYSPIPYVLIGLFLLITSITFNSFYSQMQTTLDENAINQTLGFGNTVMVFLTPILTMKLLAEERKNKVDALLLSSPVSITSIVIAKYLAAVVMFLALTASTLIYPIIVISLSKVASVEMLGGYLGFILVGASYIAFGLFASSLTESQVVAGIISLVGLLLMLLMNAIQPIVGDFWYGIFKWFSLLDKYAAYQSGKFIITPIIYYLSFISLFVVLTIRVIEKRRWS
ncbi:MAG: ABC transporter permease subunit [Clostridiales bacterium]